MFVKEMQIVMSRLKFLSDFSQKIKTITDQKELEALAMQINEITVEDWDFACSVVKRCYGLTNEELSNIHSDELLLLFSEIIQASKQPKKKFQTPLSSA